MTEYRLHGPPGCGKTHALATRWVPDAVRAHGEDRVLVASLTTTAAAEVASRLPIKREQVGTLHAHAYRAIGSPTLYTEHVDDWNTRFPQWKLTGGSSSVDDVAGGVTLDAGPLERLGTLRHQQLPESAWPHDVATFARAWRAWKEELDVVDFDDMIERAITETITAPNSPEVIIVDEAQDCSPLDLALVRHWGGRASHIVLAGDADQAIYQFRGADARAFLDHPIPEANNYHLTQSYRVPRAVHAHATRWIGQATKRYAVEYEPRDDEGAVHQSPTPLRATGLVLKEVTDQLARHPDHTVMVLVTCARMLSKLLARARVEGVPFHNPYRPREGRWNPMRGGVKRLYDFLRPFGSLRGGA